MPRSVLTRKQIMELAKSVGYRCTNPNCKRLTWLDDDILVGEAAAIRAFSPSGPRYDSKYPEEKLPELENYIWLCSSCHYLIDRQLENYPVELLELWKYIAAIDLKLNENELELFLKKLKETYSTNGIDVFKNL